MDKTLLVYDLNGKIWVQITGFYAQPEGLPYLEIEIPEGKIVTGVDVSGDEHIPIFEDLPKTETQLLQEQLAELAVESDYRLSLLELGLV